MALMDAEDDNHFDRDDATIKVGEGTYLLDQDLNINGEDLTLVSASGAEDTIIDADGNGIVITGDGVTVEDSPLTMAVLPLALTHQRSY